MNSQLNDSKEKWQLWVPGRECARKERKLEGKEQDKLIWASFKAATLNKKQNRQCSEKDKSFKR